MVRGTRHFNGGPCLLALWSFAVSAQQPANVVVIEHDGSAYTREAEAGRRRAGQRFFSNHSDAYDFLVVFPTFPVDFGQEVAGLHRTVRNNTRGIGRALIDSGSAYGSTNRLKGYIDVRSLAAGTPSVDDDVGILAHELLHQWGASVRFRDPATGAVSQELLGQEGGHWSFFFDSDASFLYGSDWTPGPSGFVATQSRRRYSSLDLYLMGLLPRTGVQPVTLLRPAPGTSFTAVALPPPDATVIQATPRVVSIDDIIAAEGERIPSSDASQKQFRAAFVVLVAPGSTPTAAQLAHVEQVRARFVREFFFLTRGLGLVETNLVEVAPTSVAQNPGVRAAVDFLVGAQLDGGMWRDDVRTVTRDTSAAVEALSPFRQLAPVALARSRALSFLDAGVPTDSDSRNRRVVALADLNQPILAEAGRGTSRYSRGYGRTSFDSALALLAESSVRPISTALPEWQILKTEQLETGAWSATPGGPGRIESTARALSVMARLSDKGAVEEAAAARGVAFLRTARRPSGLFADDRDSVAATALAIGAMSDWGRLTATEAEAARAQLLATQQSDGSWNGKVTDTALATVALGKILLPNLSLTSASVSRPTVVAGFATTATVVVRNTSLVTSEPTTVQVFDSGGNSIGGPTPVGPLLAGASVTLSIAVTTDAAMIGSTQVSVVVDPASTTSDTQRGDNLRSVELTVITTPSAADLFVGEGTVTFSPGEVTRLPQTVLVSAQVGNAGTTPLARARVTVESASGSGSIELPVAAQSMQLVQVPVTLVGATADIQFVVSIVRTSGCCDDNGRNSTTAILPFRRETAVALSSATLTQTTVVQGQDAELSVQLTNLGTAEASAGTLEVDVLDGSGTVVSQLPRSPVTLAVSSTSTRTLRWRANSVGTFSMVARLLMPGDATLGDDIRVASVTVSPSTKGNLSVGAGDISIAPSPPTATQLATVTARVSNTGALTVQAFDVVLATSTGQELSRTTLGPLAAGAFASVTGQVTPTTGAAFELIWRVDTANAIDEYNEADNTAVVTVRPVALADLAVATAEFSVEPTFPRTAQAATVSVTVTNRGVQPSAPSDVKLYEETTTGLAIGVQPIPALAAGASVVRTFTWTAPVAPGTRSLIAVVNEGRTAPEETFDNNRATRTVTVQDGSFVVSEPFFSPNGDGVRDVTRIRFDAQDGAARVRVLDASGAAIWTAEVPVSSGSGQVAWNGLTDAGVLAPDGPYSLVVEGGGGPVGTATVVLDTNNTRLASVLGTTFVATRSLERGVVIPTRTLLFSLGGQERHNAQLVTHLGGGEIAFVGETSRSASPTDSQVRRVDCALFVEGIASGPPRVVSPPGWPCFQSSYRRGFVPGTGVPRYERGLNAPVAMAAVGSKLFYIRLGGPELAAGDSAPSDSQPYGRASLERLDLATGRVAVISTNPQLAWGISSWDADLGLPTLQVMDSSPVRILAHGGNNSALGLVEFRVSNDEVPTVVEVPLLPPLSCNTGAACAQENALVGDALLLENGGVAWTNRFGLLTTDGSSAPPAVALPPGRVVDFACAGPFGYNGRTICTDVFDTASSAMRNRRIPTGRPIAGRRLVKMAGGVAFAGVGAVRYGDVGNYFQFGTLPVVLDVGERPGLFTIDRVGGVRKVFSAPESEMWQFTNYANLAASPDGKVLGFAYTPGPSPSGFFQLGGRQAGRDVWLLEVANGRASRVTEAGSALDDLFDLRWSPEGDAVTFSSFATGYRAVTTTANLSANLVAFRSPGGLGLRLQGTAQDINFESYVVEARPSGSGVAFTSVVSGTTPVVDGLFGDWSPPTPGLYELTLTVLDKGGNSRTVTTTVGWVATPALSSLGTSNPYLSPNADNVKDAVQISYSVSVPHSTNIVVSSQAGAPVRAFARTHLAAGTFSLAWDGRDELGNPVADGQYSASAETYVVPLTVDTVAPGVTLSATLPTMAAVSATILTTGPPGSPSTTSIQTLTSEVRHRAEDLNLERWELATVDGGALLSGVAQTPVTTTLVADQLRLGTITVFATDRAGNSRAAPPVSVEERVELAALGPSSTVAASAGSIFAGRVLPRVDRLLPAKEPSGLRADINFVSQEWAFWLASTVRRDIASYSVAWRRRGATSPFNIDTQLDVRSEGLVVWDARAIPPQALEIEIRATDTAGRTFVAPFSFGFVELLAGLTACSRENSQLFVSVQVALPSAASSARVNAGARVEVLPVGSANVVTSFAVPIDATGVAGRLATWELPLQSVSNLGLCKYSLRLRGSLPSGETLVAAKDVDLCQVWATSATSVGGEAVLAVEAPIPGLAAVDTLARSPGDATWRLVDTRPGSSQSLNLYIPHSAFAGCGTFDIRFVAHRQSGPDIDSATVGDSVCSPPVTRVTIPCSTISVAAVPLQGSVVDCQNQAAPQSVAILARTDSGNSFQSLNAWLTAQSGVRIAPLTVQGFVPGQSTVSATALIDVLADGPFTVTVEGVDARGATVRGQGPNPALDVDGFAPGASLGSLPSRVCSGTSLVVSGAVADRTLVTYALSISSQPNDFVVKTTRPISAPSFTGTFSPPLEFSGLAGGDYFVRLAGRDAIGNSGCSIPVPVHVEGQVEVRGLAVAPAILSPDGDGIQESGQVGFSVTEASTVRLELVSPTGAVVRELTSLTASPAASLTVPLGSLLGTPDGVYRVRATATSTGCGVSSSAVTPFVIDTVRPIARIDQPSANETVFGSIAVIGQASDDSLLSVALEVGEGLSPTVWSPVPNATPTSGGRIGVVDAMALASGPHVIRLTVTDGAGHTTVASQPVVVTASTLLVSAGVRDPAVSPNGDGVLDSTVVEGRLGGTADLTVELVSGSGAVTLVATTPNAPASVFSYALSEALLASLGEGTFEVRVTARQGPSSETLRSQLVLDVTPPVLSVRRPASNDVKPDSEVDVSVSGAKTWSLQAIAGASTRLLRAGNADFDGVAATLGATSDGPLELVLSAADAAGNRVEVRRGLTVDAAAPLVAFRNPAVASFVKGLVRVEADVTELRPARVELFSVRGTVRTLVSSTTAIAADGLVAEWNTSSLADGPVALELTVDDAAGNSTTTRRALEVDNTAPVAVLAAPSGPTLRSSFTYRGTADDANLERWSLEFGAPPPSVAGTSALLSGTTRVVNSAFGVPPLLPEGSHRFVLTVTDRAGNRSVAETVATLQSTVLPPQPTVVQPPVAVAVTRSGARELAVSWSPSPSLNVVEYRVRRNQQVVSSQPGLSLVDAALADGVYTYDVIAVDDSGAASAPSSAATGSIDNGPPTALILKPLNGERVGGTVSVIGTAAASFGFAGYELELGAGASPSSWRPVVSGASSVGQSLLGVLDARTLGEGATYSLRLTARSTSGGSAQASTTFVVDNTAPAAPVLNSATATGSSVALTWQSSASSDVRGYLLLRDEEIANAPRGTSVGDFSRWLLPSTSTSWVDVTTDGPHSYVLIAVDEALNVSVRSNTLSVSVETRAPVASIVSPLADALVTTQVPLLVDLSDNDVASVRYEARQQGTQTWTVLGTVSLAPFGTVFDPTRFPPSRVELRAVATDTGGNADQAAPILTIGVEEPLGPMGFTALVDGSRINLSWSAAAPNSVTSYRLSGPFFGSPRVLTASERTTFVTTFGSGASTLTLEATSVFGALRSESVSVVQYLTLDPLPAVVNQMPVSLTGSGAQPGDVVTLSDFSGVLGSGVAGGDGRFLITATWPEGTAPFGASVRAVGARENRTTPGTFQLPVYRRVIAATVSLSYTGASLGQLSFAVATTGDTASAGNLTLYRRSGGSLSPVGFYPPASTSITTPPTTYGGSEYLVALEGNRIQSVFSSAVTVDVPPPTLSLSLVSPPDAPALEFSSAVADRTWLEEVRLYRRSSDGVETFVSNEFGGSVWDYSPPDVGTFEYFLVPVALGFIEQTAFASAAVTVTRVSPTLPPTALTASPTAAQTVTVAWQHAAANGEQFEVERSADAMPRVFRPVARTGALRTVDAPGDGLWRYRVRALDLTTGRVSGWQNALATVRAAAPSISAPVATTTTTLTTIDVAGQAFSEGPVEAVRGATTVGSSAVVTPSVAATVTPSMIDPAYASQLSAASNAVLSPDGLSAAAVDPGFSDQLIVAEVCDPAGCPATTRSFSIQDSTVQFLPVLAFSPDGRTLAGIAATATGQRLYLVNLQTQALSFPVLTLSGDVSAPIAWSPDSTRLAFGSEAPATALSSLEVGTGLETEILSLNPDESIASMALGSSEFLVAVIRSSAPGTDPRLVRAESTLGTWATTTALTDTDLGVPAALVRNGTAIIAVARFSGTEWSPYVEGAAPFASTPSTQPQLMAISKDGERVFWFEPVAGQLSSLDPISGTVDEQTVGPLAARDLAVHGKNVWVWANGPARLVSTYDFTLVAQLAPSFNSLRVHSVSLDGTAGLDAVLPDVISTARFNDLAVVSVELTPSMPASTGAATARVTIRNLGNDFIALPPAQVRLSIVGGTSRSVTVTAPVLPIGIGFDPTASFFVPLDVSGLAGPQSLIVLLDPSSVLPDVDRSNNVSTTAFTVAPSGVPAADLVAVVQGERLDSTVTLYNPGGAGAFTVKVGIETASGSAVASAPDENVQLGATSTHQFARTLDLSTLPSGDYRVVAAILVGGAQLSSVNRPIRLTRPPLASLALAPAAPSFSASQPVSLTAAVTNLSSVEPVAGSSLELVVRNASGVEAVALSSGLTTVAPGSVVNRVLSLPAGTLAPGSYVAELQLRAASGVTLSSTTASFSIIGAPLLAGSIVARSASQLRQQQPIVVDAIVRNDGNAAASAVEAAVTLIDSMTGAVVDVQLATVGALQPGASQSLTLTLAAPQAARTHVVVLGARVAGGALTPVASATLTVLDGIAPQLSVVGLSPNQVVSTPLNLRIDASDPSGVAEVRVSIDGATTVPLALVNGVPTLGEWELLVTTLSDGPHQFGFTAVDGAGQASLTPLTLQLIIDSSDPVVTVTGVSEGGRYSLSPTISFSASDANLSTVTATLDGAPFSSGSAVADGIHALQATAVDGAGNTTIRTVAFTVDSRGPVVLLTAPSDGATVGLPVPISYTVIDASPVTVTATVDGVSFVGSTSILTAGPHLLSVVAVDSLGNATSVTRSFTGVSNSLAVFVSAVANGSVVRGPVTPVVTFTGAQTSSISLNGTPFVSGTPVASEGAWVLVATASDGVQTETRSVSFIIDRTAPVLQLTGVQNSAVSSVAVTLGFTATDATLDLVSSTLNGAPVVAGAVVSQEGPYTWVVQASDRAGNTVTATRAFIIDTTPPQLQFAGVVEGQLSRVALTPTVTVSDANPGALLLTLDGLLFASGTTVSSEGDHVLVAVATDAAGNQTTEQRQFVIDTTAPQVTVTGVVEGANVSGPVTVEFTATDARLLSVAATLDGASLVSGTVVSAEGPHVVRIEARDSAGNVTVVLRSFTIDTTPPVLAIAGVSDGLNSNQDVTIVVTTSGASTVSLTLDGALFVSGSVVSLEGPHEFLALALDLAGNSAAARILFDIDRTPPVLALAGVVDGAVRSTPVTLSFSANDRRLSAVTSTLDSASFAGGVVSSEGAHLWVVDAVDAAGNRASEQRRFILDFTPPAIAICGVTDGQVSSSGVAIAIVVTEPNPGTLVTTVDGVPFTSGDVVSSEGAHLLRVTATDAAGLTTQREVRFTIDRTAPVLTLAGVSDGEFVNRPVTLTFSAVDLLPVTLSSTVDGQPFTSGDVVAAEGPHLWRVTATDTAGNTITAQRSFTVDLTAPVITIAGVLDGEIRAGSVTPSISVTGASTVTTTLNGAPYVSGTTITTEGQRSLRLDARDAAGNQSLVQVSFTIDLTAPVIAIGGVAAGATVRGPVQATFSATDAVGIASVEGRLDGVVVVSPVPVASEGPHTLTVLAVDLAGNSTSASRSFTIDSTPPALSVTGVVDGQVSPTALTPVFSATDATALTLVATLNGQPFSSGTSVVLPGAYTLNVSATDAAGNTASATVRFTISGAGGAICRELRMTAARRNSTPVTAWDAQLAPVGGVRFALPSSLEVVTGGSSAVRTRLSFTNAGQSTACTYVGGTSTATLQSCVPFVTPGSIVQAQSLSLSVLVGSSSSSTTEVRARLTEAQPCSGVPMVPVFNFAVCAFGNVTMRGTAEVEGSVAAHGSIELTGNAELEGDAVSGGDFTRSGSSGVDGSVWYGGVASLACTSGCSHRQCPPARRVTPSPRACECGYDLGPRLSEAAANNDNNLLLRTPALAAGLGAGGLTLRNTTVSLRSGRYFFNSLSLKNARIDVARGESVELFVAGNVDVDAASRLPSGSDGRLLIVSGADSATGGIVALKAREANVRLYAPGANFSLDGRVEVAGAIVVKNATLQGNSELSLSPGQQLTPPPLTCQ